MKQLLRAGISMLAVLAALLAFRAFVPSGDETPPVSALSSSVEEVQPVSVTLPPYTPQSIPPTASPVPPPFETEQELRDYLSARLEQDGYQQVQPGDLAAFGSLPEGYVKLEGVYMRLDPGGSGDEMYIQYWYDLEKDRILSLQQVFGSGDCQETQGVEIHNLQSFPYFETGSWISFRANYSNRLEDGCVNVLLYSPDRLLPEDVEFMAQIV